MAGENETVDEIIAINRAIYQGCEECSLSDQDVKWFLDLLDRIEAAHRREVAELRECLKEAFEEKCSGRVHCTSCWGGQSCKFSKWRKALEGANND